MDLSHKELENFISSFEVQQGDHRFLENLDPAAVPVKVSKDEIEILITAIKSEIELLQAKLWAQSNDSLLIVLQGLDTAGKDSTIRRVFEGVNPQGVSVHSFKVPTPEESAHDFLWRAHKVTPQAGMIAIFNRSYYEDLLVPHVTGSMSASALKRRVRSILEFEEHLVTNNVHIVKLFLNISDKEQDARLLERLHAPDKNWKFSSSDLATRRNRKAYKTAYINTVSDTSTKLAPWYAIPADHRWYRDYIVLILVLKKMREIDPHFPRINKKTIEELRAELETLQ